MQIIKEVFDWLILAIIGLACAWWLMGPQAMVNYAVFGLNWALWVGLWAVLIGVVGLAVFLLLKFRKMAVQRSSASLTTYHYID